MTAYDYEIYIADAAVYLMATKPDLKITNPYALDETQFKAAVDLLKEQRKNITRYWGTAQDQIDAFTSGDMVVGHDLAVPGQHPRRPPRCRSRRSSRRKARPAGPTPG